MTQVKSEYLRISLIDKCNLNCFYCKPRNYKSGNNFLAKEEISYFCQILKNYGLKKIRLTGGEPTLRKDLLEIITLLNHKIKPFDLAMTTNAIGLDEIAILLKKAGLRRVNISLDSLNKEKFRIITGYNALDQVLFSIKEVKKIFNLVKINVVVLKDINDDEILDFVKFAIEQNVSIRFIERICLAQMDEYKFIPNSFIKEKIESHFGLLRKVDKNSIDGPAENYFLKDNNIEIGFISSVSKNFCNNCNRLRLSADGKLFACLYSKANYDLKNLLINKNQKGIEELLNLVLEFKSCQNNLLDKKCLRQDLVSIGG